MFFELCDLVVHLQDAIFKGVQDLSLYLIPGAVKD